ncbi:MAG: hypothetical protein IT440_03970 [Phycisphaeraceae bacterium]|nr:hypothetical protein [Phycisphaeraceae bacterium]
MTPANDAELCFVLANHWSYTGIGWSLGWESCVNSISDSLDLADGQPSIRTGINLEALAYEMLAEHDPDLAGKLRKYLDAGLVEIIGGTFGQPMGSMVSGESNLRQMVVGQQTIEKSLGRRVAVFLEEEEMSHPQIPQLALLAGYRYASMAQCDTWGRHGAPKIERSIMVWQGADGSRIVATPANALVFHPPAVTKDIDAMWTDAGRAKVAQLSTSACPPLAVKWTEFGWEPMSGTRMNRFDAGLFPILSREYRVAYVTFEQYMDRYRSHAGEAVQLTMDQFDKLLPWGIGGDQIRRFGREVEAVLHAAERMDAVAHALGVSDIPLERLSQAWRDLLQSQSHDVSLCEFSRFQGLWESVPRQPKLDQHFLPWGASGWQLMDRADQRGRDVLREAAEAIAAKVDTRTTNPEAISRVAFNACGHERDAVLTTGRIPLAGKDIRGFRVKSSSNGTELPWQFVDQHRDSDGKLVSADLAFLAQSIPAMGYDTYGVEPTREPAASPATDLHVDESALRMKNALIEVALDPVSGMIACLHDCRLGVNLLDNRTTPSPTLTGQPNPKVLSPRHIGPADQFNALNSAQSQAKFTWLEKGPVRATVRVLHPVQSRIGLDVYISLTAGSPTVEIQVRLYSTLPPVAPEGKINGWQLDLDINDGYWLRFSPAFDVKTLLRDYPFGIESTARNAFEALTFLDFLKADGSGLMLTHSGTQYFKRLDNGAYANLILREWESHFTGDYGYPRICDYRYGLTAHGSDFTHADRLRRVAEMDFKPLCVAGKSSRGSLPPRTSFLQVDGAILSAFRRRSPKTWELRLFECMGRETPATWSTSLPLTSAQFINALGDPVGEPVPVSHAMATSLHSWEVSNLELRP